METLDNKQIETLVVAPTYEAEIAELERRRQEILREAAFIGVCIENEPAAFGLSLVEPMAQETPEPVQLRRTA